MSTSVLWRRLDTPGHDVCHLDHGADGWRLEGTAVYRHEGVPARLAYEVTCDLMWRAQRGRVRGWLGEVAVDFSIMRTRVGGWTLNGVAAPSAEDCIDLDFGFTPATNLPQLRRLALDEGQAADVPAAWLDVSLGTLVVLRQTYERRTASTYWYEAPSVEYSALLEVDARGFIRVYPGLWEVEA